MPRPGGVRNGETRRRVLDRLVREADMDGIATVAATEIARPLGISGTAVQHHIYELLAEGVISRESDVKVDHAHGRVVAYRLSESVLTA